MAVGFKVKYYWYQIGSGEFMHSFFSTICYHLEEKQWGNKYPYLMNELYQGKLEKANLDNGIAELKDIKHKLEKLPPTNVIWDIDDLDAKPPWGDNISPEIKNLSTYFVTSDGEDLILVLEKALNKAKDLKEDLYIDTL
jgi:hypothetical protein